MPTEKQSAASRANSQKSTGPRTTEGRAKSRFNALKHGIYAESQIIFGESAEDLAELAAEYHEHYNPADPSERCLVDALIETEWRLRRMRRVEAGIWEDRHISLLRHKTIMEDDPRKRVVTPGEVFYCDDAKFTALQRVVSSCHRDYRGALKELNRLVVAGHARPSARADDMRTQQPEQSESPVGQALPPASATDIPVCRPTTAAPAPEAEESKPTSESPASFPHNPPATPEPPSAAPETPTNPAAEPAPT